MPHCDCDCDCEKDTIDETCDDCENGIHWDGSISMYVQYSEGFTDD